MDQLSRLNTTAGVHAALDTLPRGLYRTYTKILDGIPPEDEIFATRSLRWLAHAIVPLSLDELVEAISVEENSSSLNGLEKLLVPNDVFPICGSLVRRSELTGKLGLAHNSVYEFLTAARSESHPPAPYFVPNVPSKIVLTKTCLTYLSLREFNRTHVQAVMDPEFGDEPTLGLPGTEYFPESPFFDYTLRNWWKHLPVSQKDFDEVWSCLVHFFDCKSGNFESMVILLHRLESTYKYPMAMRPIHFCATHGLYLVLSRLLGDTITDAKCKVEDGRRPLHMAAENGHEDVVCHLLDHGADANAVSADGRTPLQLALDSGGESIALLLILRGADVNANFASGETPLSVAVGNKSASLVQVLLSEKANPNGPLPDGRTPLHVAAEVGSDIDIIEILCDNGADPTLGNEKSWTALHYAAHYGHGEAVLSLMGDKITHNIFHSDGWTPLHAAIEQEHIEIVRLFSEFAKMVSVLRANQRDSQRLPSFSTFRPNHSKARGTAEGARDTSAEYTGQSSILRRRTSPATTGLIGQGVPTPLVLATSQGYIAGVDALIEAGMALQDVEVCIQLAITRGKVAILERLVSDSEQHIKFFLSLSEEGATVPGKSQTALEFLIQTFKWNKTSIPIALKHLIRIGNKGLLQKLTEQYFFLDNRPCDEAAEYIMDVLQVAVESGDIEAMKLLHRITGADLSRPVTAWLGQHDGFRKTSCTLLHLAALFRKSDMVRLLISFINTNVVDARGRTPLHYAVEYKHAGTVIANLLLSGADISSRDEQGWTPLHVASHYGIIESVSSLLDAGAQVDVIDNADLTPLHHCALSFIWIQHYPSQAMMLLLEAGASTSSLNNDGYTPLQLALLESIKCNSSHYLSSILDQQTDLISAKIPPLDWTALHFAAAADCRYSVLLLLISRKADLEAEDRNGKTAVQIADKGAHRTLINSGARWRE